MKPNRIFCLCMLSLFLVCLLFGQTNNFPSTGVYTLDGEFVNAERITNEGKPMILVFFKTDDNKCCENLYSLCEVHQNILKGKGIKMIAVCIDCAGKMQHIKPFIYGHEIEVDVFIDKNGDFKRSMGIPNAPYTILFDHKMRIFCQYNGYCAGNQEMVCDKMNKCLAKMEVPEN